MPKKLLILVSVVLVFVFLVSVSAYANENNSNTSNYQVQKQVQNIEQENENDLDNSSLSTSTQAKQQERDREMDKVDVEEHRSVVSEFVNSLLLVANREGGIGEQVRAIAKEQNQAASTTIQAMEKIQTRSKIKTFFLGSDYKNLGTLRSEIVQTENRFEQLNKLMENTQNEADKIELKNQIQILQQEQQKIETFVNANESKFSLFGWITKLFSK